MAICPSCGQELDTDFGMFNCPSCSTMLSVDFDGNVSVAGDESDEFESSEEFVAENSESIERPEENEEWEAEDFSNFDSISENTQEENNLVEETKPIEDPSEENFTNVFDMEEESRSETMEAEGFEDVVAFGNSELSSGKSGSLVYDLYLADVDHAEIKESIRLELSDKKLLLNVDALMNSIQDGKLIIRGLSSVKAALLVNRLQHLDIEIQWKQNEIIRM